MWRARLPELGHHGRERQRWVVIERGEREAALDHVGTAPPDHGVGDRGLGLVQAQLLGGIQVSDLDLDLLVAQPHHFEPRARSDVRDQPGDERAVTGDSV